MNRVLMWALGLAIAFGAASPLQAIQESKDLSREKKLFRSYSGEGTTSVSSFCIENNVFLLVNGNISNQASAVQVYEEKNGKVIPKRCESTAP
ncbi:MAG: hypothetical protein M0009_17890 [Deltaproteobacteria bacterium]|nr:hypothetical protein [Deltaproteobacteria bacterium]